MEIQTNRHCGQRNSARGFYAACPCKFSRGRAQKNMVRIATLVSTGSNDMTLGCAGRNAGDGVPYGNTIACAVGRCGHRPLQGGCRTGGHIGPPLQSVYGDGRGRAMRAPTVRPSGSAERRGRRSLPAIKVCTAGRAGHRPLHALPHYTAAGRVMRTSVP